MSLPYELIPQAQEELDASFDHYEREKPGLGVEFLIAIRTMLEIITKNPLLYAAVHRNVREAIVPRFRSAFTTSSNRREFESFRSFTRAAIRRSGKAAFNS